MSKENSFSRLSTMWPQSHREVTGYMTFPMISLLVGMKTLIQPHHDSLLKMHALPLHISLGHIPRGFPTMLFHLILHMLIVEHVLFPNHKILLVPFTTIVVTPLTSPCLRFVSLVSPIERVIAMSGLYLDNALLYPLT